MTTPANPAPERPNPAMPAAPSYDEPFSPARATFARLMTGVVLVAVLVMASLIYWRWATVHTPTTAIVLVGDASIDGAKVEVRGADAGAAPIIATLDGSNGWRTPILLDPGDYRLTVTHGGTPLMDQRVHLVQISATQFGLPSAVWLFGSPSLGDLRVDITCTDAADPVRPVSVAVDAGDRYRAIAYLQPDRTYRLEARNAADHDRPTKVYDFRVARPYPLRLDLGKLPNGDGLMPPP